ncbi:Hypothetical protein NGAL_HAMBI1145_09650 [Neorhizobium galegae bv. officinalis]|uniref:Uncharacterized protein n=1 Tax=Neorhizobium galegae bv. officinalis TaxID=323656 RepID=A0A0T7FAX7_NEOGA|nr:Hypothetical protein NGAL_HAMBI1145_09650 [Neorhizobium galegae bv. officinalis]
MATVDRIIHALFLLVAAGLATYGPGPLPLGGF